MHCLEPTSWVRGPHTASNVDARYTSASGGKFYQPTRPFAFSAVGGRISFRHRSGRYFYFSSLRNETYPVQVRCRRDMINDELTTSASSVASHTRTGAATGPGSLRRQPCLEIHRTTGWVYSGVSRGVRLFPMNPSRLPQYDKMLFYFVSEYTSLLKVTRTSEPRPSKELRFPHPSLGGPKKDVGMGVIWAWVETFLVLFGNSWFNFRFVMHMCILNLVTVRLSSR